jgi:hypothetical protein
MEAKTYSPNKQPFTKTITYCGVRRCTACMGTGNDKFPENPATLEAPTNCTTCQQTGKETYFEEKPNPWYGKKEELDNRIKYEEWEALAANYIKALSVVTVSNAKNAVMNAKIKEAAKIYTNNLVDGELLNLINVHLKRLDIPQSKRDRPLDPMIKTVAILPTNILTNITESSMKTAIDKPTATFTRPPPQTYDHIPDLNKPQGPALTMKPVKWHDWCHFESDGGGMVDIMGRQSQMFNQLMSDADEMRYCRRFTEEYRKYAEHCKAQGVRPDPIPDISALRYWLKWVTLSDGERIYNSHYEDRSGCSIM